MEQQICNLLIYISSKLLYNMELIAFDILHIFFFIG